MLVSLALVLVAVAGGAVASYLCDEHAPLPTRLAYGATTGLVVLAIVGFIAANVVGIVGGTVVAAVAAATPLLGLFSGSIRGRLRRDVVGVGRGLADAIRRPGLSTTGPLVYGVAVVALLWLAFDRVIVEDAGGLATGFVNNLGDLPFHLQVTASFAYGENFPPENPIYAGTGFAYPYLSDTLAASLVALGASFRESFLILNLTLGLALVALLRHLTVVVTRDRLAGYIAPLLVLFSGGLGWIQLLEEARVGERGIVALLGQLTHDYTISGEGPYRWGNAITTLLVTQRSLAFGLPVALMVLILLYRYIHAGPRRPPVRLGRWVGDLRALVATYRLPLVAGVLTGCLPLIHAHTYVVVLGTAFLLGLLFRQWRDGRWVGWSMYVVAALALGLPQVLASTSGSSTALTSFIGVELGWDRRDTNVAWFWLLNTGLFIPIALLAILWPGPRRVVSRGLLLFSLAFLVWFAVPNVLRLAPWIWDNIRVLFFWFVGFVPLVALVIARALRSGPTLRAVGVVAFVALTLAGAVDVWRVVSGQTVYGEFDAQGIALAGIIRAETPPRALVLHAPTYNPPVFLTGRRSLLGYPGHVWSHGLSYTDREAEIKRIYEGAADADELLAKNGVEYIVVSPIERNQMPVNDAFFERFTMIGEAGEYRLYEVARP
jgi:hypothetical protein